MTKWLELTGVIGTAIAPSTHLLNVDDIGSVQEISNGLIIRMRGNSTIYNLNGATLDWFKKEVLK